MNAKLIIATSQFPVSTDINRNFQYILNHILLAKKQNANIIHFPELSLSGYETQHKDISWEKIDEKIKGLRKNAKENKMNIVIGVHKRNGNRLPYNTTLLILESGEIGGEYVKTKLYNKEKTKFSSKNNFFTNNVNGVKCGFLICFDSNFPDLFEKYKKKGVELLFLSYYNARSSKPRNSMDELMKSQFVTRSSDNLFYISGSNSSSKYSRMPSSFVCPDGTLTQLKRHKTGILVNQYPKEDIGWVCLKLK